MGGVFFCSAICWCGDGVVDCRGTVGREVCFFGVCFGSGRSFLELHIIYVMNVIS